VPDLLDDRAAPQRDQRFGFQCRNRIFQFEATQLRAARLDGERRITISLLRTQIDALPSTVR
jgi:hypothetical protein